MRRARPDRADAGWLRLPHGGKARALNAALAYVDTDVVLTVDADTLLEPSAIAAVAPPSRPIPISSSAAACSRPIATRA